MSDDYECSACGRKQSKIGIGSGLPITERNVESFGWKKSMGKWFCPFHAGGEEKLKSAFERAPNPDSGKQDLVEKVAEAIFRQEQNGMFPPRMSNFALYGRGEVSWEFINSPEVVNVCSNIYRKKAKAAIAAIPSLSFEEAVAWMTDNKDFWNVAGCNGEHPKEVALRIIKALTANGDVLIRRE